MTLLITPDRFKADFDALAQIGATGDGGVNRPALSEAHLEARRWFLARACCIANRNLTQGEWARYFPSEPYRKMCDNLLDGK